MKQTKKTQQKTKILVSQASHKEQISVSLTEQRSTQNFHQWSTASIKVTCEILTWASYTAVQREIYQVCPLHLTDMRGIHHSAARRLRASRRHNHQLSLEYLVESLGSNSTDSRLQHQVAEAPVEYPVITSAKYNLKRYHDHYSSCATHFTTGKKNRKAREFAHTSSSNSTISIIQC